MTVRHSTGDAVQFLEGFQPGGPWVLTSIIPDGGRTETATFGPATIAKMRDWIEERQGVQNLYFMVNRTFRALTSKASKADVSKTCAYHVDVDPRVGEDAEAERERAFKLLRAYDPPPTVIVDSGGGAQGFWLLEAEEDNPGDPGDETRHLPTEERNLTIETALQADACHNIDRIMRLPGTVNIPGEKKRAKGRVARVASVVEVDWTRLYRPEQFARTPKGNSSPAGAVGRAAVAGPVRRIESLDDLGPGLDDHTKALIVQGCDPDDPAKWADRRSELVLHINCALIRAEVSEADMVALMLDPDYKFGQHVREQPKPLPYAWRQVTRALDMQPRPGPLVIDQPMELARAFQKARRPHLLRFEGEFLDWDGAAYAPVNPELVDAEMWRFLETCRVTKTDKDGNKTEVSYVPFPDAVTGAVRAFKAVSIRPDEGAEVYPIRWLDGRSAPDPTILLPGRGGVLDLRTGEVLPATPMLFTRTALDFTPDPAAPEPELWLRLLNQWWPGEGEKENVESLQEVMGLLLTQDTRFQQHLMLKGVPGSGKSTILRTVAQMVGVNNVAAPSMRSLSEGNFGLAPLLNKTVMAVPDMRIDHRTNMAQLEENLLAIMGEDRMNVDRKNRDAVQARLRVRVVIATNELPRFNDVSGAMARRFIILEMSQSFKDKPDIELEGKLTGELAGILNWARKGLLRVWDRGSIAVPRGSRDARQDLVDLASPVPEFVATCCALDPAFEVGNKELFAAFRAWFRDRFGEDWRSGDVHFFRALSASYPKVGEKRAREDGARTYKKVGIRLNDLWAGGKIGG